MDREYLQKFTKNLSVEILDKAISLEVIGFNELAWSWRDVFVVIENFIEKRIFILGGDVYVVIDNKLHHTGDGWYIDSPSHPATNEDLVESQKKATDYINTYIKRNGEEYLFSIVADI